MALIDELKERREAVAEKLEAAYLSVAHLRADLDDLDRAIAPFEATTELDFEAEKETAREQLEREPEIPEGFTKWGGGECPVDPAADVRLMFMDGFVSEARPASYFNWMHDERCAPISRIYAYKITEQASAQGDAFSFVAQSPVVRPVPGAGEESRDQSADEVALEAKVRAAIRQEFAANLPCYSPADEAPALNADMQDEREQPVTDVAALIASGDHSYDEVAAIAYPEPQWNEPAPVTNPEADALAKAHDWYDPKAVAERQKFNPFGIFGHKRETEDA